MEILLWFSLKLLHLDREFFFLCFLIVEDEDTGNGKGSEAKQTYRGRPYLLAFRKIVNGLVAQRDLVYTELFTHYQRVPDPLDLFEPR